MHLISQFTFQAYKIKEKTIINQLSKNKNNFITAYLDRIIPPRLQVVARIQIHLHDPVVGHSQQLLLLMSIELDDKQRHSKLGQTLPRLDKLHFSVHLWQVLDIGVCLEDPLHGLGLELLEEARCQEVHRFDVVRVDADGRRMGRLLHAEERLDARHFTVVRAVGQRTTLGG